MNSRRWHIFFRGYNQGMWGVAHGKPSRVMQQEGAVGFATEKEALDEALRRNRELLAYPALAKYETGHGE